MCSMMFIDYFCSRYRCLCRGADAHALPLHTESYRVKLVLSLHVMLYEGHVMNGLLQLERILFPDGDVTDAVV